MAHGAYLNFTKTICSAPVFARIGDTTLTKTVSKSFADGLKQHTCSGKIKVMPKGKSQFELIEGFYHKCKNGEYFEELPFFKKITETQPRFGDNALVITRANGKGASSTTTVNSEGVRLYRVSKNLNEKSGQYDCIRYVYNDNGTQPKIVSTWTEVV